MKTSPVWRLFLFAAICAEGTFSAFFSAHAHAQPQLTPVTSAVTAPVDIASARDGVNMLVVEQGGKILWLNSLPPNGQSTTIASATFLDISAKLASGGERGLLGIAVHPKFAENGFIFVNYTRREDGATVIARYTRDAGNPRIANSASEKILLVIPHTQANHNGGALRFGGDGYLYIGIGDGGSSNDPLNLAQNMMSLRGKLLRIDVDNGDPYAVPNDNPFAPFASPPIGRAEIFAAGLRNPWRFSFDRENGDLYIGDVGQGAREEINLLGPVTTLQFPRTLINFGWRTLEGTRCTGLDGEAACASGRFTPPILEYGRDQGASVTGGVRYTGNAVPSLKEGQNYVFADFVSGRIWKAARQARGAWVQTELFATGGNISGFGEDDLGEVYVLDYFKGVFKITNKSTSATFRLPVVEYFNTPLAHYFITADPAEQRFVETGGAGPGWARTGKSFDALGDILTFLPAPDVRPRQVCRFYGTPGRGPNSHFYTADAGECAAVRQDLGWTYEGFAFTVVQKTGTTACPGGFAPVYRSYNRRFAQNDSNHRYTTEAATQAQMVAQGWADEGVVFCAVAP